MLYPVPAVMVSVRDNEGKAKHYNGSVGRNRLCTNPPMVSISCGKGALFYRHHQRDRSFVVNLVTKDLVFATDYCG